MTKSSQPASSKTKLVFFGNERLASGLPPIEPQILPALIEAGYDIRAVIASHTDPVSRQSRDLEIGPIAQAHKIPVILLGKGEKLMEKVKRHPAEAAVLVAFGKILPAEVINQFPLGIINVHPSLLPKYRGPTPLEQTILDGLDDSGVSLMKLAPEMDAGPVFGQQKVSLSGQETKPQLAERMLAAGKDLLLEKLPSILDGSLSGSPQNDSQATYTKLLTKTDGQLDLEGSAELLERQVRAYSGFPKARLQLHGHEVLVTKARLAKSADDGALVLECQPGWLEILELVAPSGKTMSGADFLRGYKS